MPKGHADMVRRACQAWCDGDISVYREMYAPDVVAEGGGLWPEGDGSVQGVDAVIANFESILRAFERSELIPERFIESGDALAAQLLWRGVIPGTEKPVEQRIVCAYRFRGELIVYTAWHAELDEALASLGLTDEAGAGAGGEAGAASDGVGPDGEAPVAERPASEV
jgi:ketosteroid isomerase-like protein